MRGTRHSSQLNAVPGFMLGLGFDKFLRLRGDRCLWKILALEKYPRLSQLGHSSEQRQRFAERRLGPGRRSADQLIIHELRDRI